MGTLTLVLLIWIGSALACAGLARLKQMNPVLWFFRGLAFGALAFGWLVLTFEE